jgi:hypothetical protein
VGTGANSGTITGTLAVRTTALTCHVPSAPLAPCHLGCSLLVCYIDIESYTGYVRREIQSIPVGSAICSPYVARHHNAIIVIIIITSPSAWTCRIAQRRERENITYRAKESQSKEPLER